MSRLFCLEGDVTRIGEDGVGLSDCEELSGILLGGSLTVKN